jgi:hypothetical protein
MLRNVLARQLHSGRTGSPARWAKPAWTALAAAGIAGDRRPQTLSVADWTRLLEALAALETSRGTRVTGQDP